MKITSSLAKLYGELAELRFVLKCRELGLLVSKPLSELGRYDFLVDTSVTNLKESLARKRSTNIGKRPTTKDQRLLRDQRPLPRQRPKTNDQRRFSGQGPILRIQVKSTAYQQPTSSRRKKRVARGSVGQGFSPGCERIANTLHTPKKKTGASAPAQKPRPWRINLIWSARSQPYQPNDFDILAAYIHPLDLWYIIPTSAFAPVRQLLLSPDGLPRYRHWEQFRDRWDLLQQFGLALQSARTC